MPAGFDVQPRTRLIFGPGCVGRVGEVAREFGKRALVVTDPGIVTAGHATRVEHALQAAGIGVILYDRVRENPTTRQVEECLAVARAAGIDLFVGLGGGSSMDTAKGCNFLLTNGGRMHDYWGVGKARLPMLPLLAIPTTAGTGSECQSAALIADEVTHQKMACLDPKVAARVAFLDPELTVSQPRRVTACTGIDAIAHAVETAVTRKRTPFSLLYSHEAFLLSVSSLERVLSHPLDLEARGRMLLGAAFAGVAIEGSMLGAAHAAANPLTAHFNIVHGQAVGMILPHVVRFNAADPAAALGYGELWARFESVHGTLPGETHRPDNPTAALALGARLEHLLHVAGFPSSLKACGVTAERIPVLAREAAQQWTAGFNPRKVGVEEFTRLYQAAL